MRLSLKSLPIRLLIAIAVGVVLGLFANDSAMNVISSIRHLSGQLVFFAVPLIILGFVAPAVARMGAAASKLLGVGLALAYGSAVAAAAFAALTGYLLIPSLSTPAEAVTGRALPELLFELNIPQIMPAMSALTLALLLGLAVAWTKAERFGELLAEFHQIVLAVVKRVIIPILPLFIASIFAQLAFTGRLTEQLPVFLQAVAIIVAIHLVWLVVLYAIGAVASKRNPIDVIRHYGAPYLTALGTMSSAATLPVALKGASASPALDKKAVGFGIPLFAHVHMPGSVISITFLALVVSQVLYGTLPPLPTIALFVLLLGVFAVAAPGVPGGVLTASLGLIVAVLGFDEIGTGLMLAIFALQDSFGTATNITGDGALTMILSRFTGSRETIVPAGAGEVVAVPVVVDAVPDAADSDPSLAHYFDDVTLAALDAEFDEPQLTDVR